MTAVARRAYVYLVSGIALQAAAWAAISLLRTVLERGGSLDAIAFQAAVLVVCLPVYAGHWWWAGRLAAEDPAEKGALQRRLYLYGLMALFLAPLLANAIGLLAAMLAEAVGASSPIPGFLAQTVELEDLVVRNVSAMGVLGLLWWYHERLRRAEEQRWPPAADAVAVRLAYLLGFSMVGAAVAAFAANGVLRWLLYKLPLGGPTVFSSAWSLTTDISRLVVLLATWAVAWTAARSYARQDAVAARSVLWPVYLHAFVGAAALAAVANLALILRGVLRTFLSLPPEGDLRGPLPVAIIAGLVWAYHAWLLRRGLADATDPVRGAKVQRVFVYLMATVGLAAAVTGAAGLAGVLLRVGLSGAFDAAARERLAWSAAALLAGLPVWAWAWRNAQLRRLAAGAGPGEWSSTARRVFQVLWQLVGVAMTVSGGVYLVYRLLAWFLGAPPPHDVARKLADAVALLILGLPLWLYHARSIRQDGAAAQQSRLAGLADLRPVVLATGDGNVARLVVEGLRRTLPGVTVPVVALAGSGGGGDPGAEVGGGGDPGAEVGGGGDPGHVDVTEKDDAERIASSGLLIGTWDVMVTGSAQGADPAVVAAVAASAARRLWVPLAAAGVDWAGVPPLTAEQAAEQTVAAVLQVASGEAVTPEPPIRLPTVLAWVGGVLVAVILGAFLLVTVLGG